MIQGKVLESTDYPKQKGYTVYAYTVDNGDETKMVTVVAAKGGHVLGCAVAPRVDGDTPFNKIGHLIDFAVAEAQRSVLELIPQ